MGSFVSELRYVFCLITYVKINCVHHLCICVSITAVMSKYICPPPMNMSNAEQKTVWHKVEKKTDTLFFFEKTSG